MKIMLYNSSSDSLLLNDVGSGVQYEDTITLALVDFENKIMILDNTSQISIKTISANQTILGTNVKTVSEGIAVFNDLTFISNPGDAAVEFHVTSNTFNYEVIAAQYGSADIQNNLVVNFRYCKPGEIITSNT
jgi:hypothetical protein